MSNPLLNDGSFRKAAADPGWGAPDTSARSTTIAPANGWPAPTVQPGTPITDGPISHWDSTTMTVRGTASATGVLLVLLLITAVVGWTQATSGDTTNGVPSFPGLAIVGVIVGFAAVIASSFRPHWARFLAPVYAIAEGFFLGVVSRRYEYFQDGIVLQAAGATLAVFAVMLFLHRSRILKVTNRMRRVVIGATAGLMVFYLVSFVINLIWSKSVSFLSPTDGSMLGIGFSILAAGLAALNLSLDFDFIERGANNRLPKGMEWFAAMGLLVTIVWLYLELLRLLARLNSRR